MQLNLKGFCTSAVLMLGLFHITGCGSTDGKKASSTITNQFSGTGASTVVSVPTTSSGSNGSSNNSQLPPAGAEVLSKIQNQSGWQTCGGCGNDGGTGTGPNYGITQAVTSPTLSGSSADFWIHGGPAYAGGYYFIEQPTVPNPLSYLRYEFDLYLPSQYTSAPQAIEFECQQNSGGYTYNYAWQADYASHTWRVFNYTTKHWEGTSISFPGFAPDTWHHIIAIYHASGTQVFHDSLTVDGVTSPVDLTHNAFYSGNGLEFTNAFQVDLDANGTPYDVYVDNMTVTRAD